MCRKSSECFPPEGIRVIYWKVRLEAQLFLTSEGNPLRSIIKSCRSYPLKTSFFFLHCCWAQNGEKRWDLRDMRSKLRFSSGLCFTWQVSRLSLAGGRLACHRETQMWRTKKMGGQRGWEKRQHNQVLHFICLLLEPNETFVRQTRPELHLNIGTSRLHWSHDERTKLIWPVGSVVVHR